MPDVTFKISEQTFAEVFNKVLSGADIPPFKGESPGSEDVGIIKTSEESIGTKKAKTYLHVPLPWFAVEGKIHFAGANGLEFNDGNTFTINELDIAWDKLILKVGLDIPARKFGGFCLVRMPEDVPLYGGKCVVSVPKIELFTKTPDIEISLDLSPIFGFIIITEVSAICSLELRLEDIKGEKFWAIYAEPIAVDADFVDIHGTLGQAPALVGAAVATVVLNFQAAFPATWVMDAFLGFVGLPTMTALVLDILDIHDDIEEWLMKALDQSIGIDNLLMEVIFDAILDGKELFKTPKLFEAVKEEKVLSNEVGGYAEVPPPVPPPGPPPTEITLAPVKFPIAKPQVKFDDDEMILTFDFEF